MNPVNRKNNNISGDVNSQENMGVKDYDKGIIKFAAIDGIGSIALGLGLYGMFGVVDNNAFHPLLNNSNVVMVLLVGGGSAMIYGFVNTLLLMKEKAATVNY